MYIKSINCYFQECCIFIFIDLFSESSQGSHKMAESSIKKAWLSSMRGTSQNKNHLNLNITNTQRTCVLCVYNSIRISHQDLGMAVRRSGLALVLCLRRRKFGCVLGWSRTVVELTVWVSQRESAQGSLGWAAKLISLPSYKHHRELMSLKGPEWRLGVEEHCD